MGTGAMKRTGRSPATARETNPALVGFGPVSTAVPAAAVAAVPSSSSSPGDGSKRANRENIVDVIYQTLESALAARDVPTGALRCATEVPPEPLVWIQRWGDYSAKYGLAYQYNTGAFGAYFNDATSMVLDADGQRVEYAERQKGREVKESFCVDTHPEELKKKVNLLQYFTNYLPGRAPAVGVVVDAAAAAARAVGQPTVYVRKWLKTRHAVFFRLTDNTLQVHYNDNTGIILSGKGGVITFIDKKNQMITLWLADMARHEHSQSIASRLAYIRDMLKSLISRRGQPDGAE